MVGAAAVTDWRTSGPGAYVAKMVLNRVLVRGLTWKVPFAHPEPEYSRPGGAQLGYRSVSS